MLLASSSAEVSRCTLVGIEREIGVHIPGGHLEGRASVGVHLLVDIIRNTFLRSACSAFLLSLLFLFVSPLLGGLEFLQPFVYSSMPLLKAFPKRLSIRRLLLLISIGVFPFPAAKYRQEQGVDDDEEEGDNWRSNDDRWHDDVLDDGEILVPEGKKGTGLSLETQEGWFAGA